jgi:glyoxylase-like metal-dependent hydrolase (beta-lactamase superfamily II)
MPAIAPIGVRIGKYLDVPEASKGPPVDPAKGYRTQKLGTGLYMVTDNATQSMFMVYETGVVVVDAPPQFATFIPRAIAEVTDKPITHVIYSHSHIDHIGGTAASAAIPSSSPRKKRGGCSPAPKTPSARCPPSHSATTIH